MAQKRNAWTLSDTDTLIKNFDSPIQDLEKLFPGSEPGTYRHSKASIERKMTRLRKEGRIGYKSTETVKRAYKKRHEQK